MIIRPVEAGEIAELSVMASGVYAKTFGASMTPADLEAQLRTTRSEAYFRDAVLRDTILVAVTGGAIAGYVQLGDVRLTIEGATLADQELFALYVRSDLQGQGVGKALLDAAFAQERFAKARNIYLDVWDENARAVALYTRYGFGAVGRRDFVVGARTIGSDVVMMRPAAMAPLR